MQASAVLETIAQRWRSLMDRRAVPGKAGDPVLAEITGAYSAPGRHYHTLSHIADLLQLLDAHGHAVGDRDAVELAIYFHDAVYDPLRRDNEAASAALAGKRLTALNLPGGLVAKVERYILATRHDAGGWLPDDADLALLLDLDLAVLGSTRQIYSDYARAIRSEYSMYPDDAYRAGRKKVLTAFLALPRIYGTPGLQALWEAPARDNLAWEIGELE